jgi:chromate reductase, NAD(P)H dehydrogenase (quinone)
MRILGISGSLRRDSHNTRLLHAARGALPEGAELAVFDGLGAIPPYSEDDEHAPPASVLALRDAIARADALLVATPEYNGSIPGQLKNALDWLSRPLATSPLRGKPVAVIGASTGLFGAVWAQAEARKVLGTIGARVHPGELPIGGVDEALGDDGLPRDDEARAALERMLHELAHVARAGNDAEFAAPQALAA